MMAGVSTMSAVASAIGAVQQTTDQMANAQAQAAQHKVTRMTVRHGYALVRFDQHWRYPGAIGNAVESQPSALTPYRYPSETPANWVAIEDSKDRELSRWIASLGLRHA
jgi:hypothetical protein